ncbi:MAG TPA: hypothetical protein PLJ00_05805 [Chitinophagales bacterium]|nr:hypothetical protein [Chitinophagales bacterium]
MITFKKTSGIHLLLALMADFFGDKPELASDDEQLPELNFNDVYEAWVNYKLSLPGAKNARVIPPIIQCFSDGRTPEQIAAASAFLKINYGTFLEKTEVAGLSRQLFLETVAGSGVYKGSADEIVKEGAILLKAVEYYENEIATQKAFAESLTKEPVPPVDAKPEPVVETTSPIPPKKRHQRK